MLLQIVMTASLNDRIFVHSCDVATSLSWRLPLWPKIQLVSALAIRSALAGGAACRDAMIGLRRDSAAEQGILSIDGSAKILLPWTHSAVLVRHNKQWR